MDIHKPKPIHNWRDLIKEIGVIVIGVCIALAAGPASARQVPSFGAGHPMMAGADTSAKYYDFKSAINGRTYRLFVAVPEGTPPKGGFPVVYVLDGNQFFLTASTDLSLRSYLGELRRAVMVGIDHPTSHFREMLQQRTKDLTTPLSPESLEKLRRSDPGQYAMLAFAMNGGVDSFLQGDREGGQTLYRHARPDQYPGPDHIWSLLWRAHRAARAVHRAGGLSNLPRVKPLHLVG
jgi:hypothetical protein